MSFWKWHQEFTTAHLLQTNTSVLYCSLQTTANRKNSRHFILSPIVCVLTSSYDAQNISAVERGLLTCIYWWLCCTWQLEAIVSKKEELALLPHYVRARFDSSTVFFIFLFYTVHVGKYRRYMRYWHLWYSWSKLIWI